MTKTLTEQWKDGTLDQRYYYVQYNGNPKPFVEIELKNFLLDLAKAKDSDKIEVLAPVPSYGEWKQTDEQIENLQKMCEDECSRRCRLEEQLAIATKALKDTKKHIEDFNDDPMNKIGFMAWGTLHECLEVARKALKEMKGVK